MSSATMPTSHVLSVRVSPAERQLLEQAAEDQHSKLSDFVRRKAVEAAELDLMDRRIVEIPSESWEAVEKWAASDAQSVPAVQELFASDLAWQN